MYILLFRKSKTITKKNNQPTKTISNDPVGDAFAVRAQEEQRLIRLKVCSHTYVIQKKKLFSL
jgi:hypothetical protein